MSKFLAVAFAALAIAGVSADTFQPGCSLCDRAAGGVGSTSAQQTQWITDVVNRALLGGSGNNTANQLVTVTGILNLPNQMLYFNGTRPAGSTNYYTNANAKTALVNKLIGFFSVAFACRAIATPNSFNGNVAAVHQNMGIYQALFNEFNGELAKTLQSMGNVVKAGDVTYAGALLQSFGLGAGGNNQICSAADCTAAVPMVEIFASTNSGGAYTWTNAAGTSNTITITPGTNVHWNYNTAHNVQQTQSDFSTVVSGGFRSGPYNGSPSDITSYSFTNQFMTEGTFYYICANPAHTVMHGTIIVTTGGGAGATISSSISLVVAAAIAAIALAKRV